MKYFLYLIIVLTVSIPSFANAQELHHEEKLKISIPFGEEYDYKNIKVNRVIDGDTLQLENGERVLLIGIDAPESNIYKQRAISKETGQDLQTLIKMGQEAMEFVKGLELEGKEVRLEFDVQERDKYGRLLAYVYFDYCKGAVDCLSPIYFVFPFLHREFNFPIDYTNDVFINGTIIKAGYATPMTIPPNVKYADLFKELYQEAKERRERVMGEKVSEKVSGEI